MSGTVEYKMNFAKLNSDTLHLKRFVDKVTIGADFETELMSGTTAKRQWFR